MFRYHLAQSVGLISVWGIVWLVGFWLIGRVPFVPQVAWASQVELVTQKVDTISKDQGRIWTKLNEIQLLQIRSSMDQQLKNSCLARRSHNQQDLDDANNQLSQLTDLYFQMTGRSFTLPSCATILVDGH